MGCFGDACGVAERVEVRPNLWSDGANERYRDRMVERLKDARNSGVCLLAVRSTNVVFALK